MPIHGPDPMARAMGGSESAGLQLATVLAERGHDITAFCGVDHPTVWRGVALQPGGRYLADPAARRADLLLLQRDPRLLAAA
jgi:hypothetical protein